jgi:hypothetical protein
MILPTVKIFSGVYDLAQGPPPLSEDSSALRRKACLTFVKMASAVPDLMFVSGIIPNYLANKDHIFC